MWPLLHPDRAREPGYTFDARRNLLVTNKLEVMRYDRVMARFGAGPDAPSGSAAAANDENAGARQQQAAPKPRKKKSWRPWRRSS